MFLSRMRSGRSVRRVFFIGGRHAVTTALQALLFLLLARGLGPGEFGKVAGILAFTAAALPFASLGMGQIAIRRIARREAPPGLCLGNALAVTSVVGTLGSIAVVGLVGVFYGSRDAALLAAIFGLSELVVARYIDTSAEALYGLDQHARAAVCNIVLASTRVLMALALNAWVDSPSAWDWALLHIGSALFTAVVAVSIATRLTGRLQLRWAMAWRDAREGWFFSLALSGRNVQSDGDKAILARFQSTAIAGAYTAAYRLIFLTYTPILAIVMARRADRYRQGSVGGLRAVFDANKPMAVGCGLYALLVAACLYLAAPLVPVVLGEGYRETVDIVRALCLLPLMLVTQAILSDMLLCIGGHRTVALLCWIAAGVSLCLNLYLVPRNGWGGSVVAAYLGQGTLSLGLVLALWLRRRSWELLVPAAPSGGVQGH